MGKIIGPPRCGTSLRVADGRTGQLRPGLYPCTQPEGHEKGEDATPHTSVIAWADVNDKIRTAP